MPERQLDVLIVGAGMGGLYQLYRLRRLGLSCHVVEAASGVGGTWYWNRYPGARCDHPSLAYSYSFDADLEQEWRWSEKYSPQPEILSYLEHVADRFELRRDITFDTTVTSATYDEHTHRWRVSTDAGAVYDAQFLIMATGCLSIAKMPEVPGADRFRGRTLHTGHWPHEEVDFTGERVGVIGTGSSAIQLIPIVAEQASELTVYQRTPNFSFPAGNRPLDELEDLAMKARYPKYRQEQRTSVFGIPGPMPTKSALEVSEAERRVGYEERWNEGTLVGMLTLFTDTLVDEAANETAAEFVRSKIRSVVNNPEVAEALSPRSHPLGTKRPCLDSGYYETFNRENVRLVDLRKTPIVEVTEAGVRTTAGEIQVDSLIFATGFDAMTGALLRVDIRGRGGQTLADRWDGGPSTYLGLSMAGFPNLFTITGPLSPAVLSSMFVSVEQHADWIADCIKYMRTHDFDEIEATTEAEQEWVAHAAEVADATLYPKADSWYMGSNVPGKPRMLFAYIGGVGPYRERCDQEAAAGYPGFRLRSAVTAASGAS